MPGPGSAAGCRRRVRVALLHLRRHRHGALYVV